MVMMVQQVEVLLPMQRLPSNATQNLPEVVLEEPVVHACEGQMVATAVQNEHVLRLDLRMVPAAWEVQCSRLLAHELATAPHVLHGASWCC